MSTARFNTLQNAAGSKSVPVDTVVDGSAKAWVNFNGTGTVAIRAAFNVSSITDNGTGDYTVNFASALPDTQYSCVTAACNAQADRATLSKHSYTTTGARLQAVRYTSTVALVDLDDCNVAIFR